MAGADPHPRLGMAGAHAPPTTVFDRRHRTASPDPRHGAQPRTSSVDEARGPILASSRPIGVTSPPAGAPSGARPRPTP